MCQPNKHAASQRKQESLPRINTYAYIYFFNSLPLHIGYVFGSRLGKHIRVFGGGGDLVVFAAVAGREPNFIFIAVIINRKKNAWQLYSLIPSSLQEQQFSTHLTDDLCLRIYFIILTQIYIENRSSDLDQKVYTMCS